MKFSTIATILLAETRAQEQDATTHGVITTHVATTTLPGQTATLSGQTTTVTGQTTLKPTRALRGNLASELSSAVAGASLDELKQLRKEQSISNFENLIEDQIVNLKLSKVEESLENKLGEEAYKLEEEVVSATTKAPILSDADQEKVIADKIIDEDVNAKIKDPKLNAITKAVEHKIAETVVDNLNERIAKEEAKIANGEVSDEDEEESEKKENEKLVQKVVDEVMEMIKDAPDSEDKKELKKTLQKYVEEEVAKDIPNLKTKEGRQRALQSVAQTLAAQASGILPPEAANVVNTAVEIATQAANSGIVGMIAGVIDNVTGKDWGRRFAGWFSSIFSR